MTFTIEDAINGWSSYYESRIHPSSSPVFNGVNRIWIETLRSAPRNIRQLELAIGRKKRQLEREVDAAKGWKIDTEIEALDWMLDRLFCKDFESWTKPPNR